MKAHKTVTIKRIIKTIERNNADCTNTGICIACGEDAYNVEPDARQYDCECCGKLTVYGAEELLIML